MSSLYIMDLIGTFIFAITGAFRAIKYEMDLVGVLALATAVGVGGGMTRDVLLGSVPPAALQNSAYLMTTCFAGVFVFLFALRIAPTWRIILYADAFGLGLFTAIGAAKAYLFGLGPIGVIFLGTITAVGGSFIRDISTGELPLIFTKEVYASAAIIGGFLYWIVAAHAPQVAFVAAFLTTMLIRMAALHWNVNLPKSRKLPASPSQIAREHHHSVHDPRPGDAASGE